MRKQKQNIIILNLFLKNHIYECQLDISTGNLAQIQSRFSTSTRKGATNYLFNNPKLKNKSELSFYFQL